MSGVKAGFRRLAFLSTQATYFLIFIGGLVRVSGAGMGCPDWPKCFGSWIPPLSVADLPPNIDPASFNVVLAWIEYFNRLVGMTVGLLIAATAVLAIIYYRRTARILWPSIIAALLVAFQGWQGSQVVASELEPFIVTIHMVLAFVIANLMLYVTQEAYHLERRRDTTDEQLPEYPKQMRVWVGLIWVVSLVQVMLGTQVREGVEVVTRQYPLWTSIQRLTEVGAWADIHLLLGVAVALATVFIGYSLYRLSERLSPLVRFSIWMMIVIVAAQIVVGMVFYLVGMPEVLQVFHLWLAALQVGFTLLLYVALRRPVVQSDPRQWRLAPVGISFGAVLLFVLGLVTVSLANRSRGDIPVLYNVPHFSYVNTEGQPYGLEEMKGKIAVVDFIFTRCRGACPTMAVEMVKLYQEYAYADQVQFVSISVDPDYDTQEVRAQYLKDHWVTDSRWQFIRGEEDEIRRLAARGFKVSDSFPGYHSTKFILVDQNGRIRGYYEHTDPDAMMRLRRDINVLAKELE